MKTLETTDAHLELVRNAATRKITGVIEINTRLFTDSMGSTYYSQWVSLNGVFIYSYYGGYGNRDDSRHNAKVRLLELGIITSLNEYHLTYEQGWLIIDHSKQVKRREMFDNQINS